MRVLLAEDDNYLQSALTLALGHQGYLVDTVSDGRDATLALQQTSYDLLLLDLGLPGLDGTEVLRDLRQRGDDVPVIVITARDSVDDRIHGLDLGANDYIVKPFDVRELEARIRASLRKSQWGNQLYIEFGNLKLDINAGKVFIGDKQLDLTPKECTVLQILLSRGGKVVSKRAILDSISGWTDDVSENAVEIVVHRLRKKLVDTGANIATVRGYGYQLETGEGGEVALGIDEEVEAGVKAAAGEAQPD